MPLKRNRSRKKRLFNTASTAGTRFYIVVNCLPPHAERTQVVVLAPIKKIFGSVSFRINFEPWTETKRNFYDVRFISLFKKKTKKKESFKPKTCRHETIGSTQGLLHAKRISQGISIDGVTKRRPNIRDTRLKA